MPEIEDEEDEESECGKPCHPQFPCKECAEYWDRMRSEGFWKDNHGWTDKGWSWILTGVK